MREIREQLQDPLLIELYAYWESKRGGRAMPARRDLDPVDVPRLLPHLMLLDVHGPRTLRFRVVGSAVAAAIGRDPTGELLGTVLRGGLGQKLVDLYEGVRLSGVPCFALSEFRSQREVEIWGQRLILPLADDAVHPDKLIACCLFGYGAIPKSMLHVQDADHPGLMVRVMAGAPAAAGR